nr:hypothetical protein [Deinococcus sp. Leaf326]
MRAAGKGRPALRMAARTRSRASLTAWSGRPTMENAGRPGDTSTSTSTGTASTPIKATLRARAST